MKRALFLLCFLLVMFSLASDMVAGMLICDVEIEMAEKGKAGKEVDNESDVDKDKIFQNNIIPISFLTFLKTEIFHPEIKISSFSLDTEINPPDNKIA